MAIPRLPFPSDDNSGSDARSRHAALLSDRRDRREGARLARDRQALAKQLAELPAEESEPDPRAEALAQAGAMVAFALGASVSAQMLVDGVSFLSRAAVMAVTLALLAGLAGAAWNTHVARRAFWRPVAWSWAALWLGGLLASQGLRGLTEIGVIGAAPALVVGLLSAAVAFLAAMAAAHHVDAVAARHARQADLRRRREAITAQLGLLPPATLP